MAIQFMTNIFGSPGKGEDDPYSFEFDTNVKSATAVLSGWEISKSSDAQVKELKVLVSNPPDINGKVVSGNYKTEFKDKSDNFSLSAQVYITCIADVE